MTSEKVANLIHMVEQQHRTKGFHDNLEAHKLTINDWAEMLGVMQRWYEGMQKQEATRLKTQSIGAGQGLEKT